MRAGVIDYLEAQKNSGFNRPFHSQWNPYRSDYHDKGRHAQAAKWSHGISKWGGNEFVRLKKAGKIKREGKETYFHSMRHTFATYLAKRGVSEESRALLSGHAFGAMNAERYTKLRGDHDYLSKLVEEHMVGYVGLLDAALANPEDPVEARKRPPKKTAPAGVDKPA